MTGKRQQDVEVVILVKNKLNSIEFFSFNEK